VGRDRSSAVTALAVVGGDVDVHVDGDRVVAVGAGLGPPIGAAVVDAAGCTVVAGFVDLQCNGAGGVDLTSEPERLWEVAALLPRYGVTAWLPTIVTAPPDATQRALAALADRPSAPAGKPVAEPIGLHLEGPFLAPSRRGAHDPHHLADPLADGARAATWSREAGVAMVTLAPELPGALDLAEALLGRGVVVAAGHTDATASQAAGAADRGVTVVTHLFNAMAPLHHRAPGLAGAALTDPRWRCGVIADGLHLDPAVVALAWSALGERLVLVTDAVAALGAPPGPVPLAGAMPEATGHGVRLADGTLAGSDLSMDRAVRNLAAFSGCSLTEAAAAASAAPASVLGLAERGQLAPGALADVVVLSPGGEVVATIVRGVVAWRS
jgi:N-acetylglucosamine-6-phosphate deacetylase